MNVIDQTKYIVSAAAYVRVSTQEQKLHGLSLDAQKEKLTEYAKKHNIRIVEWYLDEGVSGRKLIKKRPELQRMIHDAQAKNFERILFIKLDRFFRSVAEYHECMKLIDPVIWTATEEKYDLSTANGRAFVNMKLTIAELEADQTGERIRLVNDYKVKAGLPLCGTNAMPFCYHVVAGENGGKYKRIEKNPATEPVMVDLIEHYLLNQSLRAAMTYVNQKYGTTYEFGAVRGALTNEMICGSYKGNPNYCDPYIDRETFERIQSMISRNPRTTRPARAYLFSGLLPCPHCGNRLAGTQQSGGKGRKPYKAYRCNKCKQNRACDFKTVVRETSLEKIMLESVEVFFQKAVLKSVQVAEEKEHVNKHDIAALQQELDRLNYSWQKGRIKDVAEYDKKYDAILAQIAEATREEAQQDSINIEAIEEFLHSDWKEIYTTWEPERKQAFWHSFIEKITIVWDKGKENKRIADIKFF